MIAARAAVALALAAAVVGCFGPRPVLERQTLEAFGPHATAPLVVEAVIRNTGRGSGQIEVEATIVTRADHEFVARGEVTATLDAWQRQSVVVTIPRPPSSDELSSDDVELRVAVRYPVD
jgi:hypothetical protein